MDVYIADANFKKESIELWSTHPTSVVVDWIMAQHEQLHKSMAGRSQPLQWKMKVTKTYFAVVSPLSAVLGVVGRLLGMPSASFGGRCHRTLGHFVSSKEISTPELIS